MSITMPNIDINFTQKAATLIQRSERGYAILIIKDDTNANTWSVYKDITEVEKDKAKYTADNLKAINDAFLFGTYRVCVARIQTSETVSDALTIIEKNIATGWIAYPEAENNDQQAIATWIKTKENEKKTYKAVVYKATTTDCRHVVNFYNGKVTYADGRGEVAGNKYLATLVGIFASCNVAQGCTYFKCTDLTRVVEVADRNAALNKGQFILFNDTDCVRIAADVNSLTTTNGNTLTEDMRYIETVEVMDLILDDIREEFKNNYLRTKNKLDNQILFISAINGYFKNLGKVDILDSEYNNTSNINVEAQRDAWITSGKAEAETWEDATVKKNTFKRNVYLKGDIKILGSMVNLEFDISLF